MLMEGLREMARKEYPQIKLSFATQMSRQNYLSTRSVKVKANKTKMLVRNVEFQNNINSHLTT